MAGCGFDSDTSGMTIEDEETVEIVDPASFSFPVQNRFDARPEMQAGWGGNWQLVDRQASKRKKTSSSSMDNDSFMMLSNDEKLVCLFETLNKNYDKLSSLEVIQRQCIVDNNKVNNGVVYANKRLELMEKGMDIYSRKLKMLSYRSIDIESRSRRNNIVFWGITENMRIECKQLIQNFMRDELVLDPSEMYIERAHRLGSLNSDVYRNKTDPKRPIIVRFRDYIDTERVLEQGYRLKGSNFGIDRDYPKEIASARKELYSCNEAKEARRRNLRVQIKFPAKLYIEGRIVRDMFPGWFDVMKESRIDGFDFETKPHSDIFPSHSREAKMGDSVTNNNDVTSVITNTTISQNDITINPYSPKSTDAISQSPSILDSVTAPLPHIVQNVNNDNTQSDASRGSVTQRNSKPSPRVNKVKDNGNINSPASQPAQRPRVFKSPRRGRSKSISSNANSKKTKSSSETQNVNPQVTQLSKSVERVRKSRSVSKNRTSKNPSVTNIDSEFRAGKSVLTEGTSVRESTNM